MIAAHDDHVSCISVSADQKLLASKSSRDNTVKLWDTERYQVVACLEELGDPRILRWHSGIAFHPTQRILATLGDGDQSIRLWSVDTQALVREKRHRLNGHE